MSHDPLAQGDRLDETGRPGTALLRREHTLILRALAILERAGHRLLDSRLPSEATFAELVEFLQTLDRSHHVKEEDLLFPALRAKGRPADSALAVLLAEHEEGRDYLGMLSGSESRAERTAAALLCVHVLRQHIEKEEQLLFPLADDSLSPDEHVTLARRYEEIRPRIVGAGTHDVLEQLARLEAAFPP
jgi:hemerythrin-like domain-containing protein